MWRRVSRTSLIAAVLLAVALGLRIAEVEGTAYRPVNDAGSYLTLASEVAHTGDYSSSHAPGSGAGGTRGPSAYFPPAFPYFLAAIDLVDGHRTARGAAIQPARISQAVLGTATVALVGLVAFEVAGAAVGLVALGLAAIYPVLVELSALLVAENLMSALVLGAVYSLLRARRCARPYPWIAAAGALTGLATLTHVNAAIVLLALLPGALATRRTLSAPALLLAAWVLVLVPWTIRNAEELHRFIPVSDESGITLAGTYNRASAANHRLPYKWRLYYGIPGERPLIHASSHLTELQLSDRLQSQALRYISSHPLSPLAVLYHNTLRLLELEGSFAWQASATAVDLPDSTAQAGVVSFWLACLLALGGTLTSAARRAPRWLWAVPVLLWLSVAAVNAETPRFREPVDPYLLILAACAVAALAPRLVRRARLGPGSRALARAPVG